MTQEHLSDRSGYGARDPRALARRNGGVTNVVRQMRAERLRLVLMRASFGLLALVCLLALVWVLPWFSWGLTWDSYDGPSAGAVVLLGLAGAGAFAFLAIWGPLFAHEPLPEFLRVLLGGHQLIRGRQQFYSRLGAECGRAHRDRRYAFSLIMVQRSGRDTSHDWLEPGRDLDVVSVVVRGVVRGEDVVATAGNAIWVLVSGAGERARERVVDRLAEALAEFEEPFGQAGASAIGASTFGEDGDNPELLLLSARQRMRPLEDFLDVGALPAAAGGPPF